MTTYDIAGNLKQDERALGNIVLNLDTYRLCIDGCEVETTYHELELLRVLLDQPERIVGFTELTHALWGTTDKMAVRHLNVLVHRLRAKLTAAEPYTIETVRGRGYGFLK